MILTDKEKLLLTPTYHVFEMYKVHQGATLLPLDVSSPEYTLAGSSIPSLHASASRDKSGKLHVSIVNLDPNRSASLSLKIIGTGVRSATGRILTGPAMNSMNTFDQPEAVKPVPFNGAVVSPDQIRISLPAKAVVVLELS
jgi:alpha-N-arabinofuranosidase